jgi:hypothetical protein
MTVAVTGSYTPGDYLLLKNAGRGDSVMILNKGPSPLFITAPPLGKDFRLSPNTFVSFRFAVADQSMSIHVPANTDVDMHWVPA